MARIIKDDLVIVLAGEAGQGIQSIEGILAGLLKKSGYYFFSASEFMSRVRGGSNSTEIRVSSTENKGYRNRIDLLIPLHPSSISHLKNRITSDTLIVGEKDKIPANTIIDVPFTQIAVGLGNAVYSNTVAAGFICGLLDVSVEDGKAFITEHFSGKKDEIQTKNREAFQKGMEAAQAVTEFRVEIKKNPVLNTQMMLTGSDAVALGALAGGCDYVCGYPMSPATGVLEKMADISQKFGIIVEQVEDEVGVVNMALGAWYAGARAFVSTSGGGFALMSEGISLCGMIESPLVLHLAQRPGPATGLPTRTEQGDLNLVLYAGHGDFPRIILAPGNLEQGYSLTQKAFDLSAEFQVPVFLLTDQFYVDSRTHTEVFEVSDTSPEKRIVNSAEDYKRFQLTPDGISPRAVPGYGAGVVCADSDEHDETGHITEDLELRVQMVDKRMRKIEAVEKSCIPPLLSGDPEYQTLVVCWGSTLNTVTEAVTGLGQSGVAVCHLPWVFPVPPALTAMLQKAKTVICIENNATGQLAQLILSATGFSIGHKVLKYNGLPFSVEEVQTEIQSILSKGGKNGK